MTKREYHSLFREIREALRYSQNAVRAGDFEAAAHWSYEAEAKSNTVNLAARREAQNDR